MSERVIPPANYVDPAPLTKLPVGRKGTPPRPNVGPEPAASSSARSPTRRVWRFNGTQWQPVTSEMLLQSARPPARDPEPAPAESTPAPAPAPSNPPHSIEAQNSNDSGQQVATSDRTSSPTPAVVPPKPTQWFGRRKTSITSGEGFEQRTRKPQSSGAASADVDGAVPTETGSGEGKRKESVNDTLRDDFRLISMVPTSVGRFRAPATAAGFAQSPPPSAVTRSTKPGSEGEFRRQAPFVPVVSPSSHRYKFSGDDVAAASQQGWAIETFRVPIMKGTNLTSTGLEFSGERPYYGEAVGSSLRQKNREVSVETFVTTEFGPPRSPRQNLSGGTGSEPRQSSPERLVARNLVAIERLKDLLAKREQVASVRRSLHQSVAPSRLLSHTPSPSPRPRYLQDAKAKAAARAQSAAVRRESKATAPKQEGNEGENKQPTEEQQRGLAAKKEQVEKIRDARAKAAEVARRQARRWQMKKNDVAIKEWEALLSPHSQTSMDETSPPRTQSKATKQKPVEPNKKGARLEPNSHSASEPPVAIPADCNVVRRLLHLALLNKFSPGR